MDPLTHVFLPLLVAYAARPDLFGDRRALAVAGVGLLPDADKFVGAQGLLHSLVPLVPLIAATAAAERRLAGRYRYTALAAAFLASHLLLDLLDGGPTPLLYPFVTSGVGLVFPATVTFGQGPLGVVVDGPLVALRPATPRTGYQSFGFVNGFGAASALAFLAAYAVGERRRRGAASHDDPSGTAGGRR